MELTTEYNETLHLLRNCSPAEISRLVATEIPQDRLPLTYLNSLSEEDRTVCLRVTLICWVISKSTMVPREMQLRVVLADAHAKDALIAAGTGSDKTLPIALCILLDDPTANYLSITISPLIGPSSACKLHRNLTLITALASQLLQSTKIHRAIVNGGM